MLNTNANVPVPEESAKATQVQAAQVLRQFRVVFNAVRTHFQQVERQVGIGGAKVWALHLVHQQPGISMGELARAMDIHQSTASNLVKFLSKKKLLRIEKAKEDRRGVRLFVESDAVALLQGAPMPYEGVLPKALQDLPIDTLAQLQKSLSQLILALEAENTAAGIPLAEL
ncbi:MAG: MarR family transcriptional regulator [Rhodocyclaceae bacterium]|jgi:DNA-binding MarR family transcriptional regulator|nr:MarR family transcriptional regulator [Rhodocyclaceae bacterium]